ncbi:MAG TPA: energy transducer TonB [Bryobacteraceae bacterium]|nr:energy transducer TonB [Bryobacteraceae bacterium]
MSGRTLVASIIAALPMVATAQVAGAPDSFGIEVNTGPYKLLHRAGVEYPPDAVPGDVVVSVSVNATGEVTDARVVSGPEPQRSAVLRSVLAWHFSTETPLPPSFEVTVRFLPRNTPTPSAIVPAPPPQGIGKTFPVKGFDLSGVPESMRGALQAALPVREGDVIDSNRAQEISSALKRLDRHLSWHGSLADGIIHVTLVAPGLAARAVLDQPTPSQRIRVGGNVQEHNLIHKVDPEYPPLARQASIQGTVRFNATIGKDGRVTELQLVSGHPLLVQAATEAVRQWVYKPTLLNGNPVEVVTTIDVNFTLNDVPPPAQ